jgi:hypothetical protein
MPDPDIDHSQGELARADPPAIGQDGLLEPPAVPQVDAVVFGEVCLYQVRLGPQEPEEAP